MNSSIRLLVLSLFLILFSGVSVFAQKSLPFIRVSPHSTVSQDIGFANINIDYSRPAVKDREIWNKLVPYGLAPNQYGNGNPMPWRAGANENTTITLSHPARINDQNIEAGTYSLHIIPQEKEWVIIFNSDHQAWGSFFYDEKKDVVRIRVVPQEAAHQEWLQFGFEDLTLGSAHVYLHWAKLKVVFEISFDQHKIVLDKYRNELTNLAGFYQIAWGQAARYCLQNDVNPDEAMNWIDKALSMNDGNNFNNLSVKAGLLTAKGNSEEAESINKQAVEIAGENELNTYGYQLMGQEKIDEAIEIFKLNIERHPDSWNVYDSLAEAMANKGDKSAARKNYQKALKKAPEAQHERINGIIQGL